MVTFVMMIQSDPLSSFQNFHIFDKKQNTTTTTTDNQKKNILKHLGAASDRDVKWAWGGTQACVN